MGEEGEDLLDEGEVEELNSVVGLERCSERVWLVELVKRHRENC